MKRRNTPPYLIALIANQARTVKNGHIHTGKQRYLCRNCGRQFVKNPTNKVIDTYNASLPL